LLTLAASADSGSEVSAQASAAHAVCRIDGNVARLAAVPEASGIAVSRRTPGRFWSHNDSGQPVLFAFDADGTAVRRVTVTGAAVDDWEAVATAPCPSGSCVYLGDIGDNDARRDHIVVYRIPEPDRNADATARAEVFRAKYPDGPRDAEALLVSSDGRMYVVTKGSAGPVALYAFPRDLKAGSTPVQLQRIGDARPGRRVRNDDQITDGSISSDGAETVLRTHDTLFFFRTRSFLEGNWTADRVADLKQLREPQGEGVAFGPGEAMYLISEGGGDSRAGRFTSLVCPR
jgi:hypothetical protein